MQLDWPDAVSFVLAAFFFTGICLLKSHIFFKWNLKNRAYMRRGFAFGMIKDCGKNLFLGNPKKKTPFESISIKLRDYRAQKLNREIFESIVFLRNLASIDKGREYSSDTIIEKLSEHEGLLRPVFIKMLNLLRLNQPMEAAELFSKSVGTQAGRDFSVLLIKWDRLEPGELMETLLSYEKSMKASRITSQKRKDEIVSELIYFPVVINILVIFINFIYIAYFIEQKEMLMMIM